MNRLAGLLREGPGSPVEVGYLMPAAEGWLLPPGHPPPISLTFGRQLTSRIYTRSDCPCAC